MINGPLVLSAALSLAAFALFVIGALAFSALAKGCLVLRRRSRTAALEDGVILLKSPLVPAVSMLAVPQGFTQAWRDHIRLLLDLHFGEHEVVVVLDGPSPQDLEAWTNEFRLCASPRASTAVLPCAHIRNIYESRDPIKIVVVVKDRGGEPDALNAAINVAAFPVVGLVDPACDFEPTLLQRLIVPMLEEPQRTVGVCGIAPPPAIDTLPGRIGALELLRTWLGRCAAFSSWGVLIPVPGSSVLVRREAIVKARGFSAGRIELLLHLHGRCRALDTPYRIELVAEPVSRPRPPATWADLRTQAIRDQWEILRAWRNSGSIGLGIFAIKWALPGLLVTQVVRPTLEIAATVAAIVGLAIGWIDWPLAGVVLLATCGLGIVLSMAAVVFRELAEYEGSDPARLVRLFLASIPENLGFRHLQSLWLIGGFLTAPKVPKQERRGEASRRRPPAAAVAKPAATD